MLVDEVKTIIFGGNGGEGKVSFGKIAKSGPDGGDGGSGGHIYLKGNKQLWTLIHLKYRKHIFASNGENGTSALKTGADGNDIILEVPLGTVARDAETQEVLFEITGDGEQKVLKPGGRGGLGNNIAFLCFTSIPDYKSGHFRKCNPFSVFLLVLICGSSRN